MMFFFEKMGYGSPKFKYLKIPTIILKYVKSSNKFQNHLLFQTKFDFVQILATEKLEFLFFLAILK
jgi:hypothetical protein